MFDFIRNHSKLVLGFLVLLIIPSFVFFGIENYSRFNEGTGLTVAKVDGQAITQGEWDAAHQRVVERMRRQMPTMDTKMLETPQYRRETLEQLMRERVLMAAANKEHLWPDDDRVGRLFRSDPQFAALRNPDGSVRAELLAAQGMNSQIFLQQLRQEMGMQQVIGGVANTAFATAGAANPTLDAMLQRREVQLQRFDTAEYKAKVNPTDADLAAYYKGHDAQFRAPEQAAIEYVVLSLDALGKGVTVPEEDLRRYYDENASRYSAAEERRASHSSREGR